MKIERAQQWTTILNTTYKMLKFAHEQNWQALVDLELTRRTQIETFFSIPIESEEVEAITRGTRQILDLDKEIMALSRKQRDAIGTKLKELDANKKANNAYLQNTG